ncbi:MAG: hypothetical protein HC849_23130 [Oscillatoriales cyanobacterium RU_3_3]|nr:hypothetical protein [Microcoleus sp. SU_5_3]NJL68635.1 hypothetical protein [Microcoleus sp. SM1_3_4]NJM62432.1 hypothetical protein [Oscillatoriales cyanobacterium RU_3_3]
MSVYQNYIKAFVDFIESQSDLFSAQDWSELNQLASDVPNDDEAIANEIENWLESESRSHILQAYEERLEALDSSSKIDGNGNLGPGKSKSPTPPDRPSESSKEMVENAIKKNSPLLNPPPTRETQN